MIPGFLVDTETVQRMVNAKVSPASFWVNPKPVINLNVRYA